MPVGSSHRRIRRPGGQRPCDGRALLLSAGELPREASGFSAGSPGVSRISSINAPVRPFPVSSHRERHIFIDAQHRHQIVGLEYKTDLRRRKMVRLRPSEKRCIFVHVHLPLVRPVQPPSMWRSVDFPEPEVPTTAANCPCSTDRLTPSRGPHPDFRPFPYIFVRLTAFQNFHSLLPFQLKKSV